MDDQQFAPLVDVSDEKLADLLAETDEDSALNRSVQRLVRSLDDPAGVISSFGSFIGS